MTIQTLDGRGVNAYDSLTYGSKVGRAIASNTTWTKVGIIFTLAQIQAVWGAADIIEDSVVWKGHDGYYYMAVSAGIVPNLTRIYLVQASNLNFTGATVLGVISQTSADNWKNVWERVRHFQYDPINERYVVYYSSRGTVAPIYALNCVYATKANLAIPANWVEGPNNPFYRNASGMCGPFAFQRYGGCFHFYNFSGNDIYIASMDNLYGRTWALRGYINIRPNIDAILRCCMQVPGGWLIAFEYFTGAVFQIGFIFYPQGGLAVDSGTSYDTALLHPSFPNITVSAAFEFVDVFNPYLYRELGNDKILHLFYGSQNAGGSYASIIRAYTDITMQPPGGETW